MCKTKLINKNNENAVEVSVKEKKFTFFTDELEISEEEILSMSDGQRNNFFDKLLKKLKLI